MTPLLIIKTVNGFAAMPYTGEIPQSDLCGLMVASLLESSYSYRGDGLIDIVKQHFTPPPEPTPKPRSAREIAEALEPL